MYTEILYILNRQTKLFLIISKYIMGEATLAKIWKLEKTLII